MHSRSFLFFVALIGSTSAVANARLDRFSVVLPTDTLPIRHRVSGNTIPLKIGNLCEVRAQPELRYAGGRRFILKSVADAEQHFFLSAQPNGDVERLYWLQAEELLPDSPGGYDYAPDSLRSIDRLNWWVNLRSMNGPVQSGSDRAAMVAFLSERGFHLPGTGRRLRLVYLPEAKGRREFMVVYLEAAGAAGRDTSFDATLARARRGLQFKACS